MDRLPFPPSYTDQQLKTYEIIQRNRMAWVALIILFVFFAAVLTGLMYAAFSGKGAEWFKIGLAVLDGLLGTCIVRVVFFLFPRRAVKRD